MLDHQVCKTVIRFLFAFLLSVILSNAAHASDIVLMAYPIKSSDAPVRVLDDRKFVICDACPPYDSLSQMVQVVRPRIAMRFSRPPVKMAGLATTRPAKESRQPLEITVYFPFGEFRLKGGESAKLDAAVESLKAADKIEITGYTCRIGSKRQNDILAIKRASEVATYLSSGGISREKMEVKGTGKCCYRDNTRLDINRRVEVKTINK
jgi:outer membrane protein OmpA-like peptidoglycan-associated protein